MSQFLKIAQLDAEDVEKVTELEESLGVHLMAYEDGFSLASLSDQQMETIKSLEEKLGVVLLAFDE